MADKTGWWRRHADGVAHVVFAIVIIGGLFLIGTQLWGHWGELAGSPFSAPDEVKTVVTKDTAGNVVSTEVTTQPDSSSIVERALAPGGLLFVRIAIVVVGAFIAGGLTKKVLAGDYDIKIGGFELKQREFNEETKESIKELRGLIGEIRQEASQRSTEVADAIETLGGWVIQLDQTVDELNAKVAPLTSRRPPP